MEEICFHSQSIEEKNVVNDGIQIQQTLFGEVREYIEGLQEKLIEIQKSNHTSFADLRQLKETDICVDLQHEIKLQSNNFEQCMANHFIEQKNDLSIGENLFIGSNPGLFYSETSGFDQESRYHHLNQELASIGKLTSLDPTQKNIVNHINGKDNSLQISGDTILDITTSRVVLQDKPSKQETPSPVKIIQESSKKSVQGSFFHIPQHKSSRHSKYCDITVSPMKKKRDFVVPVIHNDRFHKKSTISREEYFLINDKNLTNFFVTKDKRNYVDKLGNENHSRIKDNDFDFQKSSVKEENNQDKTFRRSQIKKFVNTNRESASSNHNLKLNHFNLREQHDFASPNATKTKLRVKMVSSDKTKKLFNQSISTFISHNYRPITCRKQFRKPQQSPTFNQQLTNQWSDMRKNFDLNDKKENKMIKKNLSCDDIALKNSFKKASYNSTKGKKLKLSKSQKHFKSFFLKEKQSKQLINFRKVAEKSNISPQNQKEKETQVQQQSLKSSTKKQNTSQITLSTNSQQKRLKNITEFQLEMMKNNNIKRVKKFKQVANSKLDIVAKMGVKIMVD